MKPKVVLFVMMIISLVLSGCAAGTIPAAGTTGQGARGVTPIPETPTPTPVPATEKMGLSREHPVPLGVTVRYTTPKGRVLEITLSDVQRGEDVAAWVNSGAFPNEPLSNDLEYLTAWVKLRYIDDGGHEQAISFSSYDFESLSSDGQLRQPPVLKLPFSTFGATGKPPMETEGRMVAVIARGDPEPLLVFNLDPQTGEGGLWFATK